ncbi:hypothetical protein ACFLRY_02090 [Bacteroidota bacterium]
MKKPFLLLAFLLLTLIFVGQNTKNYRQVIENNKVPQKVRMEFKKKYPEAIAAMWFITSISYWYQDYGPSYYNGWYESRTVTVYNFNEASNYEVEFINHNENCRAIFNRYGTWFETRTKIKELPSQTIKALEGSEYDSWQWSEHKERIEAPGMPGSVYRMKVSQRNNSQIIRISEQGKIVQIKTE